VAARVLDRLSELMEEGGRVNESASRQREDKPVLTTRERDVLEMLAGGARNRDIAAALSISERTVKVHVANLMGKLEANTRTEAVARAIRLGLLSVDGL